MDELKPEEGCFIAVGTFLFGLVIGFVFAALLTCWQGYVVMKLWNWFIPATFGLKAIAFVPAMGLSIIIHFLTMNVQMNKAEKLEPFDYANLYVGLAFFGLMSLFTGWFVHMFMPV